MWPRRHRLCSTCSAEALRPAIALADRGGPSVRLDLDDRSDRGPADFQHDGLGDVTQLGQSTPWQVPGLGGVVAVAAGASHNLALTAAARSGRGALTPSARSATAPARCDGSQYNSAWSRTSRLPVTTTPWRSSPTARSSRVILPRPGCKTPARRAHERQRWFRRGQRWRVGCEGRISVLKRRHGLRRRRYHGADGTAR